jgi:hypothetical protein
METLNTFIHLDLKQQACVIIEVSSSRIGHCFTGEFSPVGPNKVQVIIDKSKMKENETFSIGDNISFNDEYIAVIKNIGLGRISKSKEKQNECLFSLELEIESERFR